MNTQDDDFPFDKKINNFSETIRTIPSERRYWFVRTFGGELFEDYYVMKRIGLLANNVPLDMIKLAHNNPSAYKTLQNFINYNIFPDNASEATKLANQLVDFYHKVKIDDIIMMPSSDSNYIAFGKVISGIKETSKTNRTFTYKGDTLQFPTKYHEVEWITIKAKSDLIGDIKPLMSSHSGLTNADKYSEPIESNISSLFEKEDYYYFSLFVDLNENQELNAFELSRYLEAVTKLYKHYCIVNDIEENEDLFLKIKIQSPGSSVWKWSKPALIAGVSIIATMGFFADGGEISYNKEGELSIKTTGNIFKNITNTYASISNTDNENEDKKLERKRKEFELLKDKKEAGLLTKEEVEKYHIQLRDSSEALQLKEVESKSVNIAEAVKN